MATIESELRLAVDDAMRIIDTLKGIIEIKDAMIKLRDEEINRLRLEVRNAVD